MYLFEDNGHRGKITVYDFSLRQEEAKKFRMSEMSRIKKDKVPVYMVTELVRKGCYPIFSKRACGYGIHDKEQLANVRFLPHDEKIGLEVLEKFYDGELTYDYHKPKRLIRVYGSDDRHSDYYLVGRPSSITGQAVVDVSTGANDVIKIPKSLYLLSAIEQKQFNLVCDDDITRQIKLFDFKEVKEIEKY